MTREEILKIAKPIQFNTEAVRANQKDIKTEMRLLVRYKYDDTEMKIRTDKYGTRLIKIQKDIEGKTYGKYPDGRTWRKILFYREPRPPYKRGDYLYVRETWARVYGDSCIANSAGICPYERCENAVSTCFPEEYIYKATDDLPPGEKWKPSIHMPKDATRIFLRVTDVRPERLQDITADGIRNEGLTSAAAHVGDMEIAKAEFEIIWNSTIKQKDRDKYGWSANPWVWVIRFERVKLDG